MGSERNASSLVLLHDRSFSAAVSNVTVCPNMDLFAAVLDRISIAIFRKNCQRLATISACTKQKESITAYTWSPDGANIALASSSGALSIYSVDQCSSAVSKTKRGSRDSDAVASVTLPTPASTLLWADTQAQSMPERDRSDSAHEYQDRAAEFESDSLEEANIPCKGLLIAGDENGAITIYTHNLQLRVAHVQALCEKVPVRGIHMSSIHPHALAIGYEKCDTPEQNSTASRCVMRIVNLESVFAHLPEIDRINREVKAANNVIQTLSTTMKRIRKEWVQGAMAILSASIQKPIEKLMRDFAEDEYHQDAWSSLYDVYCGAKMKNGMLQHLGTDLSESGAKEALRSFRAHADDVEEAVMATLPIAEQMTFRASEYRGLARVKGRFERVGVRLKEGNELFEAAQKLCGAVEQLMDESERMCSEAEAFLGWVVIAAAKAGGMAIETADETKLHKMSEKDKELVSGFLKRMSEGEGDVVSGVIANEVEDGFRRFEKCVQAVFEVPAKAISSAVSMEAGIWFGVSELGWSSDKVLQWCWSEGACNEYLVVCMRESDGELVFARYGREKNGWKIMKRRLTRGDKVVQVWGSGYVSGEKFVIVSEGEGSGRDRMECFMLRGRDVEGKALEGEGEEFEEGSCEMQGLSECRAVDVGVDGAESWLLGQFEGGGGRLSVGADRNGRFVW